MLSGGTARPRRQLALWAGWLALVALFTFCWKVMTKDTIWSFISDAPRQAADIGDRMIPPAWKYFGELIVPLWDTINIATLGTLLAIVIAVPVAFNGPRCLTGTDSRNYNVQVMFTPRATAR
jgi:phosphonate transport system permease protein